MRVCIAAGGTGGHLLPGLAAAKELRSRGHPVHFIVRTDKTSQPLLAKEGFASSAFFYAGFPRKFSGELFTFPFLTVSAGLNARRILKREKPDALLGMGGYITVPVGAMARLSRVPLVLHEQNSHAGLANRLLSRWAVTVAVSFPETVGLRAGTPVHWTGLPLRPDLEPQDPALARQKLGLDPQAMTFLIFGGSQGARALNRLVVSVLTSFPKEKPWQVVHLTGQTDFEFVEGAYRQANVRAFVKPFWSDMAAVYSAADFVVSRSGANTVMELIKMGKQALLVPFPYATDNHQETNARFLEKSGAARIILERDLTPARLRSLLSGLPDPAVLREENHRRLQDAFHDLSRGAAARLADLLEKVAATHERGKKWERNYEEKP